ncbi:Arylsulfatase G [Holothuria leucospilota]|uniref:Arylsulfatase G n=1 Tax=Holothuria leucospilota TaxID=206669 RepID=A0A9Q1H9K7_HOLLE|nr:Arylsulfatase G [Holothuria leucospilota]
MFNVIEDPAEASPLDPGSTVYGSVLEEVNQAMVDIERSVQMDRTPIQDWIFNRCTIPCCNALNVACRCY